MLRTFVAVFSVLAAAALAFASPIAEPAPQLGQLFGGGLSGAGSANGGTGLGFLLGAGAGSRNNGAEPGQDADPLADLGASLGVFVQ